ncbi:site-specific integrase [Terriglobus sp. TAA 43]|uniref:tyrosine-type recombinase/integrase n=1 Tax=Terriglobus sp. TAA 43 TaxID=278961 RepID=UPI000646E087|nr:site-specific integrase [Terriglobus sp. TAA 43]
MTTVRVDINDLCAETLHVPADMLDPSALRGRAFAEAAALWLESRRGRVRSRTFYGFTAQIRALNRYFGEMDDLEKIHLGHVALYQRLRAKNCCIHGHPEAKGCKEGCEKGLWTKPSGHSIINHELSVLQMILRRAGLWNKFSDHYERIPADQWQPPKVMTSEQEAHFYAVAASKPDWELAGLVAMLTANTTASGTELRNLQHKHVMLNANPPAVRIPLGKNRYRLRVIPLNDTAVFALKKILDRAEALGSTGPDDFIFPYRVATHLYDPKRPTSSSWLRRTWYELREAADVPWLTPHCLRHQAITMMAEQGVPSEVIRSVAGHVSEQMMRHYTHCRLEVTHKYLSAVDGGNHMAPVYEERAAARKAKAQPAATSPLKSAIPIAPVVVPPQKLVTPAVPVQTVQAVRTAWGFTASTR